MSTNHRIRVATPEELHYRWAPDRHLRCSARNCTTPAVYLSSYDYITGKQGRWSDARRLLCEEHGKKFARRYQLELPIAEVVS